MKNILDKDFKGKRVIIRTDFNVPVEDGIVREDFRIVASIPTIKYIADRGGKILIVSHRGRPEGVDESLSLKPIAQHLASLLGEQIDFFDNMEAVKANMQDMTEKSISILENIRFEKGETEGSKDLAKSLASIADVYVNDAFAVSHRKHTSVYELPKLVKESYYGILFNKEVKSLNSLRGSENHPILFIMGGAKAKSKVTIIDEMKDKVDMFCFGGVLANEMLLSKGVNVGKSLITEDEEVQKYLESIKMDESKVCLPIDFVVSKDKAGDTGKTIKHKEEIEDDDMILDIGPETVDLFASHIVKAKTIFFNGPLGYIEDDDFEFGTMRVLDSFKRSQAEITAGGGESILAIDMARIRSRIDHLSTGGGAMLEYIASGKLECME